ncbi:hypothetical protein FFLO_03893 [Filobasidium floriforme]|uniref:NAD(P)-binding protein n=1 Tax=Filobasidium floriforme TaxID=5210 RepID=A0A8K0NMV1_9TREE|nr:uncharacterized protein HD553DRAFT_352918 [Filobasidium floriforme]KAG7532085.1 hypothetical protein FFLO_03893 [Filobasidium floriforme]KAH8078583.1 hypothetical protein HD553DRAFT_352918 [Filobasidium floriforme]
MTGLTGMFSERYTFDDIPDQTGKVALVTGGSAGIGAQIVLGLALNGAEVHFISTTPAHGEETESHTKSALTSASTSSHAYAQRAAKGKVIYHQLDLGDLSAVKAFGEGFPETIGGKEKGLDLVVCNAGIGVAEYAKTKDGLACHFGVNHISHMLLIHTLLPLLDSTSQLPRNAGKKGAVRVVMQASQQHKLCPSDVKFESFEECQKDIGGNGNYARSKLMNILYAKELSIRKLIPSPISNRILTISVHPGAVATDQEKAAQEPYGLLGTALVAASRVFFMSPEQGSESALWAATSGKVEGDEAVVQKYQGAYLTQPNDSLGNETNQAKDMELAKRLWDISVNVIKDKVGVVIDY